MRRYVPSKQLVTSDADLIRESHRITRRAMDTTYLVLAGELGILCTSKSRASSRACIYDSQCGQTRTAPRLAVFDLEGFGGFKLLAFSVRGKIFFPSRPEMGASKIALEAQMV